MLRTLDDCMFLFQKACSLAKCMMLNYMLILDLKNLGIIPNLTSSLLGAGSQETFFSFPFDPSISYIAWLSPFKTNFSLVASPFHPLITSYNFLITIFILFF
ncbi:hypothetical protein O6H91_22G068500 [Diphasiastrum complanatum]|uniref:Uncharacterized protein n=1 Tax=Diphasiastrum complanatum TaxID=34168 RepID=A0ACC2AIE5_DIPCM|nr:hypothetical protein O6H91_22G068500 [Diphasiastrum complanatum]